MPNNSNSWWKWRDEILAKTKKEDMPEMKNLMNEYYSLIKVCALMSSSKSSEVVNILEEKKQRKSEVIKLIETMVEGSDK